MANQKALTSVILLTAVVISAAALYFGVLHHPAAKVEIDGVMLPQTKATENFNLTDNHGKSFTQENLKGHWTMVFFGFTNCGMVCPTTMAALSDMYKSLGNDLSANQLPQVVMVSVDPDRDSVQRMNDYVAAFNPSFIGIRGGIGETITLENQLHIAAAKIQTDEKGKDHYTINHSAEILLFNPKGELQAYLSYPHEARQMAKDYKTILAAYAS